MRAAECKSLLTGLKLTNFTPPSRAPKNSRMVWKPRPLVPSPSSLTLTKVLRATS